MHPRLPGKTEHAENAALITTDLDTPLRLMHRHPFVHWIIYALPATATDHRVKAVASVSGGVAVPGPAPTTGCVVGGVHRG